MTSTNHFRGRRLSRSIAAPVSPRPHHFGHVPNPVSAPAVLAIGAIQVIGAVRTSNKTLTGLTFTKVATDIYRWIGTDNQSNAAQIDIVRVTAAHLLYAQYYSTANGALAVNAEVDDLAYFGAVPYLGAVIAWYAQTIETVSGTNQFSLPAGWPP